MCPRQHRGLAEGGARLQGIGARDTRGWARVEEADRLLEGRTWERRGQRARSWAWGLAVARDLFLTGHPGAPG